MAQRRRGLEFVELIQLFHASTLEMDLFFQSNARNDLGVHHEGSTE